MTTIFSSTYRHPLLTEEDLNKIESAHNRLRFGKGHVLLQEGQTANEYYILESGLIRAYVLDYEGNEITTEFFTEGEIVIVPTSLFQRIPSSETLVTVTDAILWKINFDEFQKLYHSIQGFSEWGRSWFSTQLFSMKQRSLDMITETATHRYLKLMKEKPQIIRYVPLKQIASYLGITSSSLSRIRKEIAHEN